MNDDILGVIPADRGVPLRHSTDGLIEAQAAEIDRLTAERDQLAAQVAALVEEVDLYIESDAISDDGVERLKAELRANLPAAAARYLAARKVADAFLAEQDLPATAGIIKEAEARWKLDEAADAYRAALAGGE